MTEPVVDPPYLSIRECAERGLPLNGNDARTLAEALRAAEQGERRALRERDDARLQARLFRQQLQHVGDLLTAWQSAAITAISRIDPSDLSPISDLLRGVREASARANESMIAEIHESLARFNEASHLYPSNSEGDPGES
jgi:hypothetical protein